MNLPNSDLSREQFQDNTNEPANFCFFGPQILDVIELKNQNELSVDILARKLKELNKISSSAFLCGEKGNNIDNGGVHIWFIENYTEILKACQSQNNEIANLAESIFLLLENLIRENTTNKEGLIIPSIKPVREDLGQLIIHGFIGEGAKSGNEQVVLSRKGFTPQEVERILQNN